MLPSIYKVVATATAAGVLLTSAAAAPIFAETASTAPDAQVALASEWKLLEPGASHTIQIHYDAHQKNGRIVSETVAQLEMSSAGSVAFDVYTAAQYKEFVAGEDVTPIGRGSRKSIETGNEYHNTKLLWANRTSASETFYIRVKNRNATTSSYQLNIWGKGTSFKGETASTAVESATMESAAMESAAVESANEVVDSAPARSVARSAIAKAGVPDSGVSTAGVSTAVRGVADGPDNALSVGSDAGTLAAGETRWYTFKYDYDHSSVKPPKQSTVQVKMNNKNSVAFEVWTPMQVRDWINGETVTAIGAGSVAEDVDTNLIWVGSASATDRYYVLVENLTDSPVGYSINIGGSTVSY